MPRRWFGERPGFKERGVAWGLGLDCGVGQLEMLLRKVQRVFRASTSSYRRGKRLLLDIAGLRNQVSRIDPGLSHKESDL
jgi:hypothetical protein